MTELLFYLCIKHFIADALLQTPYQYLNKGKFGHPGGIIHAGIHGVGTLICVALLGQFSDMMLLAMIDFILHYTIDYVKMNLGSKRYSSHGIDDQGKPCLRIYNNLFFYWLIADQCAHFATYVFLAYLIVL